MNKRIFSFVLFVFFSILLISSIQAISNPAAKYCIEEGYEYEVITREDGSQSGACDIQGRDIEEWEFYKEHFDKKKISFESIDERILAKENLDKENINLDRVILEDSPKKVTSPKITTAAIFWDWRDYNGQNWVSSIKDQGACGSCSIFSVTGVVESKSKINLNNGGYSIDLSEQDVISCDGGGNCSYGWPEIDILNYIKNIGVVKESCFGYTATDNTCNNKCSNGPNEKLKISNYGGISANENSIKQAINDHGSIIAQIVVCSNFNSFSGSGIYTHSGDVYFDDSCWNGDFSNFNWHSISIVGYNDTGQYWVIKNSWGTGWGDSGYVKIAYSQSVYDYSSWINAVLNEDNGDNRVFFLDNSYYVSGTDITTAPTVNSALANNTYSKSSTSINFSVYTSPNSIKQLSSVKINGTSMTGSLQYGGIFSTVKTPAQLGCTTNSESTCSLPINITDDSSISSITSVSISVDDLAPRVTEITLDDPDSYVNSAQMFTISASVSDASISKVRINNSDLSLINSLYKLTTNATNIGCTSTICNLTIFANDTVGNINNSQKKQIVVDDSIPRVALNYPNNNSWIPTTSPKLKYTFTDSISPNASCILTINGAEYISNVSNNTLKEVQVTSLTTNTQYLWDVSCTDLAGNINVSNQWLIKSDTTAPFSSIILNNTANSNGWIRLPTLVNITATDTSGSGVNYTQWKNSSTGNWMNVESTFVLSENISDNIIYYKSVDKISNIELEKQKSFKYDATNPIISSTISSSNLIAAGASFTVDVFASDSISGLDDATLLLNGTSNNLIYSSGKYSGALTAPATDGIYNLTVNVTDRAGNYVIDSSLQITVNSTLPTISVDKPNGTIVSNNSVLTITFGGIENAWYNYTGGTEILTNSSTATLIINGSDMFNLWIWANNSVSTTNQNYTYIIDTTIPAISFSTPSTNLTKVNGSLNVIASSSDTSGIASVVLAIDRTNFVTDTTSHYSFNIATTSYSDGLHILTLNSTDNSGLSNSTELTINITNNGWSTLFNVAGDISNSAGIVSQADLLNTLPETVVDMITGLSSSIVIITFLENAPNNPSSSQLSTIIGKINISAETETNSRIYITISKETLINLGLTSPYSSIAFYADHGSGVVGPLTSSYVDTITKEGIEYGRFYLETTDYSIFFWGIPGVVISPDGSSSSSGGGGGGDSPIVVVEEGIVELSELSVIKKYAVGGKHAFNYNGKEHSITINSIEEDTVNITIASTSTTFILKVNELAKKDLDDDGIYDMELMVLSIGEEVEFYFKKINEEIDKIAELHDERTPEETVEEEESSNLGLIFLVSLVVIIGIFYLIKFSSKKKPKIKKKTTRRKRKTTSVLGIKIKPFKW